MLGFRFSLGLKGGGLYVRRFQGFDRWGSWCFRVWGSGFRVWDLGYIDRSFRCTGG